MSLEDSGDFDWKFHGNHLVENSFGLDIPIRLFSSDKWFGVFFLGEEEVSRWIGLELGDVITGERTKEIESLIKFSLDDDNVKVSFDNGVLIVNNEV